MCADFGKKKQFYTIIKQENVHFITKFCQNISENNTLLCFNQDNSNFSTFEHHAELSKLSRVHSKNKRFQTPQILSRWTIMSRGPCWKLLYTV